MAVLFLKSSLTSWWCGCWNFLKLWQIRTILLVISLPYVSFPIKRSCISFLRTSLGILRKSTSNILNATVFSIMASIFSVEFDPAAGAFRYFNRISYLAMKNSVRKLGSELSKNGRRHLSITQNLMLFSTLELSSELRKMSKQKFAYFMNWSIFEIPLLTCWIVIANSNLNLVLLWTTENTSSSGCKLRVSLIRSNTCLTNF